MQTISLHGNPAQFNHQATCRLLQQDNPPPFSSTKAKAVTIGLLVASLLVYRYATDTASIAVTWLATGGLFLFLAGMCAVILSKRRAYIAALRTAQLPSGETSYDLSVDGIRIDHAHGHSVMQWSAFEDVINTSQGLVLRMSGIEYVPIPANVFASPDAQLQTFEQIKAWMK